MTERIIFPEWRRENEPTRYPFAPHATLVNAAGVAVTEGVFLDASLYPVGGLDRLYLSAAVIDHQTATLYVGDAADPRRCSGVVGLVSPDGLVVLADAVGRPAGVLVSEPARLAVIQSWGTGTHEFDQTATEFCATCCVPTPEPGLRGVLLDDGELLTGDVWLVGSDGVVLRRETAAVVNGCGVSEPVTVVRVDVVGDPLFRRRLCQPRDLFVTPDPVRRLRLIAPDGSQFELTPDARGNVQIVGGNNAAEDTILRVYTTPAGVRFEVAGIPTR